LARSHHVDEAQPWPIDVGDVTDLNRGHRHGPQPGR
jgi:hypothetical protein